MPRDPSVPGLRTPGPTTKKLARAASGWHAPVPEVPVRSSCPDRRATTSHREVAVLVWKDCEKACSKRRTIRERRSGLFLSPQTSVHRIFFFLFAHHPSHILSDLGLPHLTAAYGPPTGSACRDVAHTVSGPCTARLPHTLGNSLRTPVPDANAVRRPPKKKAKTKRTAPPSPRMPCSPPLWPPLWSWVAPVVDRPGRFGERPEKGTPPNKKKKKKKKKIKINKQRVESVSLGSREVEMGWN